MITRKEVRIRVVFLLMFDLIWMNSAVNTVWRWVHRGIFLSLGEKRKHKKHRLFFIVFNPAFCSYVMKTGSFLGNTCFTGPLLQSHKHSVKCFLAVNMHRIFGSDWVCAYLGIIIEKHVWNLHFHTGVVDGSGHISNSQKTILYCTWRHKG